MHCYIPISVTTASVHPAEKEKKKISCFCQSGLLKPNWTKANVVLMSTLNVINPTVMEKNCLYRVQMHNMVFGDIKPVNAIESCKKHTC